MPEELGKAVVTTTTMDTNLNHCLATGKSLAGCLHFVNKLLLTGIPRNKVQYRQPHMVQSLLLQKQQQGKIMDIRQTLRYLGAPTGSKSFKW